MLDRGRRVVHLASVIARVLGAHAVDGDDAGEGAELIDLEAGAAVQRRPVLQPREDEGLVALAGGAHDLRAHPFGRSVKIKWGHPGRD